MTRRLWIAVERHVVSRDIIGHAAEVLGRTRAHVLGHMVAMWGEVAEDAKSGDVSDVRDSTIEHWAQWDGEPGAFAAFVRDYCVTDGCISGWDEMQGRFEREKKADAERKAASRRCPPDVRKKSAGHPRKSTVTIQDNTIQDSTTTTVQPAVAANAGLKLWLAPIAEAWELKNGPGSFAWGRYTKALKPLFGKLEAPEVARRLTNYLASVNPGYESVEKFVQTHGRFDQAPRGPMTFTEWMGDTPPEDLRTGRFTDKFDLATNPDRAAEWERTKRQYNIVEAA